MINTWIKSRPSTTYSSWTFGLERQRGGGEHLHELDKQDFKMILKFSTVSIKHTQNIESQNQNIKQTL